MAGLEKKDIELYRLASRAKILEAFVEHMLLCLHPQVALDFLREFSSELTNVEHKTFHSLDAALSDMASDELDQEIVYLRSFVASVVAKVIQERDKP